MMTSSTELIESALDSLLNSGRTFILMVQSDSGNLTYYTNSPGDKLFIVNQEDKEE
jgi:hypothetical protein